MDLRKRCSPNGEVPSSLQTEQYVLTKREVAYLMPALYKSKFVPPAKLSEGMKAQEWGVMYTAEGMKGVHPDIIRSTQRMIKANAYLKSHATAGEPVVLRVSVVEMGGEKTDQVHSRFQPQHRWHKDGHEPLITMVYVLYDGGWDSKKSPGAFELGGRVALADRPCGNAYFESTVGGLYRGARSGRTISYYPPTNSLYVIPGFVDHAVFKLEDPAVIRHAVVVFLKPRSSYVFRGLSLPADEYLRMTWAIGVVNSGAVFFCAKCMKIFGNKRQLYDHRRRETACKRKMQIKRLNEG